MKRITIVAYGLSNGGAERVSSILANGLSERGYAVQYLAVYSHDIQYSLSEKIEYVPIRIRRNKYFRFLTRNIDIVKAIDSFKSDIVISFIIDEMLLCSLLKKIPLIYTLRNDPVKETRGRLRHFICNYTYRRAEAIVFQTPGARDFFDEEIRRKGIIIGNPLTNNLPFWNTEEHQKKIITACRLTPQKNIPMLIKGFSDFSLSFPEYSLWIYGNGELKESLVGLVNELGIENKVFFPGYADDIHKIMSQSAIFALTSNFEGLSNSMLEALAIGIPTICTDCPPGGASLYIRDHENGLLIPVGDEKALSNAFSEVAKGLFVADEQYALEIRNQLSEDEIIARWIKVIEKTEKKNESKI